MSSYGSRSMTARATVRPPKPESKIPMGASVPRRSSCRAPSPLTHETGCHKA